jgi:hypothetical protein
MPNPIPISVPPKKYEIDFNKVKTLEDIKLIIKHMNLEVTEKNLAKNKGLKRILKEVAN